MSYNAAAGSSGGAIALRNAAQKSLAFSSALSQTVPRVQSLHRDVLRAVPWTKRAYGVSLSEQKMRSLLSDVFRDKKEVNEITTINRLIALGRMELEETLMLWKGESHIKGYFESLVLKEEAKAKEERSFLDKFLDK
mmetsp:Transcript_37924/g.88762  ORF Transcript_37924/g.88762 Transcript_37924/m.88762 type:complete len:137 (-) Transcript_37924:420-830(-)|eukprot:CAMPEP_0119356108 /NCGR_PEP_ID=MMETSP1334-20130426/4807_1 /TAXON_ID=127549 /ORGANISM="Calcidiscus leptoporus, Strain RCC1130" /LENGTH=136 /DNA_ID=CAMNT_0007370077 /DNA_START=81 /DNA_END=491 /DNA_ORIENTATION=+